MEAGTPGVKSNRARRTQDGFEPAAPRVKFPYSSVEADVGERIHKVRTATQLFAVGFPVTLATGLAMLSVALPFLVPAMEIAVMRGLARLVR